MDREKEAKSAAPAQPDARRGVEARRRAASRFLFGKYRQWVAEGRPERKGAR